jgi:predicted transcriptional regulator
MVFTNITNDLDVINFIEQNNKYKNIVKIAYQKHGKFKNKLYPELGNFEFISEIQKNNFLNKKKLFEIKFREIYVKTNTYYKILFEISDYKLNTINKLLKDIKKYKKILNVDNNIDTKSDVSDTEQCIQNNLHKPENKLSDSKNTKLFKVTKSKTVITKYYNV